MSRNSCSGPVQVSIRRHKVNCTTMGALIVAVNVRGPLEEMGPPVLATATPTAAAPAAMPMIFPRDDPPPDFTAGGGELLEGRGNGRR